MALAPLSGGVDITTLVMTMLTRTRDDATVQIIYISDTDRDVALVKKNLQASEYRIHFSSHSSSPSNMTAIFQSVSCDIPLLPTAIIIDYDCVQGRCIDVICDVRRMLKVACYEVIIHNAPTDQTSRDALKAVGADSIISAAALCCEPMMWH